MQREHSRACTGIHGSESHMRCASYGGAMITTRICASVLDIVRPEPSRGLEPASPSAMCMH